MKLTFGSEFVYDWLQVEIEWYRLLYFWKPSVEIIARKVKAVA